MFLTNFDHAKNDLIQHLHELGLSSDEINNIVEFSLRMSRALITDTQRKLAAALETVTNDVGAYKWEIKR